MSQQHSLVINPINADSYFYGIIGGNSNEKKIWWNLTINASTDKLRIVKYVAKAVNQAFNLHSLSNTCIWYDKFSIDISISHYLINTWISKTFITYTGTVVVWIGGFSLKREPPSSFKQSTQLDCTHSENGPFDGRGGSHWHEPLL